MFSREKRVVQYTFGRNQIWIYLLAYAWIIVMWTTLLRWLSDGEAEGVRAWLYLIVASGLLLGFPIFVWRRIKSAYKICALRDSKQLVLNVFVWRKLSWRTQYEFAYSEIQSICFSGGFSGEGKVWLLLRNGGKILLKSSHDQSRAKIFARQLAERSGLPFELIKENG